MRPSQYEQYRGVLAGIVIRLDENRRARQAMGKPSDSESPEVRTERLRLYNENVLLHRDRMATLRTAEALLSPGEFEIINTEADLLAEEWLANPSEFPRAPIYFRSEGPNYLQHFKKMPDGRIRWDVEIENPRRDVAGGMCDTHREARDAAEAAIELDKRKNQNRQGTGDTRDFDP
jgi:hypothetical protein